MKSILKFIIRLIVYPVIIVLVLATIGLRILDHYSQLDKIKPQIETGLSEFLQRRVTIESIDWQWVPQPVLYGTNVRVYEKNGDVLLYSPEIRVVPELKRLIHRQLYIQGVRFLRPTGHFRWYKNGSTNFKNLYQDIWSHLNSQSDTSNSLVSFYLRTIRLSQAKLEIIDENLKPTPLKTNVFVDGSFVMPQDTAPVTMSLTADIRRGENRGAMSIAGSLGDRTVIKAASSDFPLEALGDYLPPLGNVHHPLLLSASLTSTSMQTRWRLKGQSKAIKLFTMEIKRKFWLNFDLNSISTSSVQWVMAQDNTAGWIKAIIPQIAPASVSMEGNFDKLSVEEAYSLIKPFIDSLNRLGPDPFSNKWLETLLSEWKINHMTYKDAVSDNVSASLNRAPDGQWRAQFSTPKISFRNEQFSISTTTLIYQNGDLSISDINFQGLGGEGTVNLALMNDTGGAVGLADSATILGRNFDITWDVTNLDSLKMEDFFHWSPYTTGRLTSKGRLLGDRNHIFSEDLKGSFNVDLKDGVISSIPGAVKFLSSANIKSLIKKIEGKKVQGLIFQLFKTNATIDQGIMKTVMPATLHSDLLDLLFVGEIDLKTNIVNAEMELQFLTVLDEVIKFLPGIKQILIGKRKSLVPIWIRIQGPVDDPLTKIEKGKRIRR